MRAPLRGAGLGAGLLLVVTLLAFEGSLTARYVDKYGKLQLRKEFRRNTCTPGELLVKAPGCTQEEDVAGWSLWQMVLRSLSSKPAGDAEEKARDAGPAATVAAAPPTTPEPAADFTASVDPIGSAGAQAEAEADRQLLPEQTVDMNSSAAAEPTEPELPPEPVAQDPSIAEAPAAADAVDEQEQQEQVVLDLAEAAAWGGAAAVPEMLQDSKVLTISADAEAAAPQEQQEDTPAAVASDDQAAAAASQEPAAAAVAGEEVAQVQEQPGAASAPAPETPSPQEQPPPQLVVVEEMAAAAHIAEAPIAPPPTRELSPSEALDELLVRAPPAPAAQAVAAPPDPSVLARNHAPAPARIPPRAAAVGGPGGEHVPQDPLTLFVSLLRGSKDDPRAVIAVVVVSALVAALPYLLFGMRAGEEHVVPGTYHMDPLLHPVPGTTPYASGGLHTCHDGSWPCEECHGGMVHEGHNHAHGHAHGTPVRQPAAGAATPGTATTRILRPRNRPGVTPASVIRAGREEEEDELGVVGVDGLGAAGAADPSSPTTSILDKAKSALGTATKAAGTAMRKARRAAAATAAGTPLRLVDGEEEQEEADGQEDAAGVDGPAASGLPSRTARRRTAAAQEEGEGAKSVRSTRGRSTRA